MLFQYRNMLHPFLHNHEKKQDLNLYGAGEYPSFIADITVLNKLADYCRYGSEREIRSAHDCRRTYASLEYLGGTPINVIKEQMGHSSVGQTWDYIKNVVEASERRGQLKGARLLFEDVKSQEEHKYDVNAV